MLVIGEKINIISTQIGKAMKERDAGPIRDMAKKQVDAGANLLEINIGPATKGGPEMMEWLVKTVQEVVDVPLSLDTTNAAAMEAGLKVHKGRALINSTSGEEERMKAMLPLAKQYDADIIGLTLTGKGIPRDANERVMVASEIMTALIGEGISLERLYLDPLILSVAHMQAQSMESIEAIRMFKQLNDPPIKTVVGLSNVFNGCPEEIKGALGSIYLVMLLEAGLDAAIMDPLDDTQMHALKTFKVFKNDILYCHSYLNQ